MAGRMITKRRLFSLVLGAGILATTLIIYAFPARGQVAAATIRAASCFQADVQAAIDAASDGDTVAVPAGGCTWTVGIVVSKGIKLQGAGVKNTVISGGALIRLITFSPSSNLPFELSGFTFVQGSASASLLVQPTADMVLSGFKVHDNAFHDCASCFYISGATIEGVVYNNTFTDRSSNGLWQFVGARETG
jgi:hypothetical protein